MENRMFGADDLNKIRLPLIDHIHLGYKIVKCKKCSTVKKLKEIEQTGKCPKCGTTYPKDNRGISFYTQATNHFVVPEAVAKAGYGNNPVRLHIAFPTNIEELILKIRYCVYDIRQNCLCNRDVYPNEKSMASQAVPIYQVIDEKDKYKVIAQTLDKKEAASKAKIRHGLRVLPIYQTRRDIPCPKENCELFKTGQCKFVTTFDFLLPRVPQLGVWRIATGSSNSAKNLIAGLKMLKRFFGSLCNAEFLLDVYGETKVIEGKFKKITYILRINYEENLKQIIDSQKAKLFSLTPPPAKTPPLIGQESDVVIEAPENEVPEDIISPHIIGAEVIEEEISETFPPKPDVVDDTETETAGVKTNKQVDSAIDSKAILKELKTIIDDENNDIGREEDINPIYRKLGIPADTRMSTVPVDKLPALLEEVKKLVKKPVNKPDKTDGKKKLF